MTSFFHVNPLVSGPFGLASFSLFGFPFLSGFYSKDLLEFMYISASSLIVLMLIIMTIMSTCVCSLQLMYYSVWKGVMSPMVNNSFSFVMGVPIFIMGVVVVFFLVVQ